MRGIGPHAARGWRTWCCWRCRACTAAPAWAACAACWRPSHTSLPPASAWPPRRRSCASPFRRCLSQLVPRQTPAFPTTDERIGLVQCEHMLSCAGFACSEQTVARFVHRAALAAEHSLGACCVPGAGTAGAATEAARTSFISEVVGHLAQVLRDSGFSAALRNASAGNAAAEEAVVERQRERQEQLRAATQRLIVAGLLASACLTGHLAHIWPGRHHSAACHRSRHTPAQVTLMYQANMVAGAR